MILSTVQVAVQPTEEPIALVDLKTRLGIDAATTAFDTALASQITTARRLAEKYTRRAFCLQTLDFFLDYWPGHEPARLRQRDYDVLFDSGRLYGTAPRRDEIVIPFPPTKSIVFVKYVDLAFATQTLDPTIYWPDLAGEPARIRLKTGNVWPTTADVPSAVNVRVTAGVAAADVESEAKEFIFRAVGYFFENREAQDVPADFYDVISTLRDLRF